ncbi:Ubiquitin-conjugating enzyme E2 S-A [Yarrowia sp. C11]|nr:Ubiquitin-conjugating enzyme E2 S-A [Yarrowia sp. C11]KAG5363968.1 Ubiquitin-conjugating enzyme E2 S-A [Yarrowia sp. E02]
MKIKKDVKELFSKTPADICVSPDYDGSLQNIAIVILGPEATPYHGGAWQMVIKVPSDYPQSAPKAFFKTRIFHPNVQPSTGEVCVDTLKRDWTPTTSLCDILITIRCLLVHPNPESALNEEAGKLLLEDYAAFSRTARLMTNVHALNRSDYVKDEKTEPATSAVSSAKRSQQSSSPDVEVQKSVDGSVSAASSLEIPLAPRPAKKPKRKTGLKRL